MRFLAARRRRGAEIFDYLGELIPPLQLIPPFPRLRVLRGKGGINHLASIRPDIPPPQDLGHLKQMTKNVFQMTKTDDQDRTQMTENFEQMTETPRPEHCFVSWSSPKYISVIFQMTVIILVIHNR